MSAISVHEFPDLQSVPQYRRLVKNPVVDKLRLAIPFDFIAISGLDVDDFRFGEKLFSDTTFPPAFIEATAMRSHPASRRSLTSCFTVSRVSDIGTSRRQRQTGRAREETIEIEKADHPHLLATRKRGQCRIIRTGAPCRPRRKPRHRRVGGQPAQNTRAPKALKSAVRPIDARSRPRRGSARGRSSRAIPVPRRCGVRRASSRRAIRRSYRPRRAAAR